MRSRVVAAFAVGLYVLIGVGRAPAQVKAGGAKGGEIEGLMKKGAKLRGRGEYSEALKEFQNARGEASRAGLQHAQAEAMIQAAQTHQDRFSRNTANTDDLNQAVKHYESAIKIASPAQVAQAKNNLGTLHLKNKDFAQAVRVLSEVDRARIPPDERFVYDFNLGRARDLSGSASEAYLCYVRAVEANPKFTPAAERAFENLRQSKRGNNVVEALRLAEILLKSVQSELAASEAFKCLDAWGEKPDADRLLTILVRHYAVTSLAPDRFLKDAWPQLKELQKRRPTLDRILEEIHIAFAGDFGPAITEPFAAPMTPFAAWWRLGENYPPGKKAFPELLKKIGDWYYQPTDADGKSRDAAKALARYTAAWSLDGQNTEAALFIAAVLRDHPRLDPANELYHRLIEALFQVKGALYQNHPDTATDWANLMRMHFLLGSIFESDRKWGSESEPKSAIYQWSFALRAEDELRKRDKNYPPTPGLHQHLGQAYKATNERKKSLEQFLCEAEESAELGDLQAARSALVNASDLGVGLDPKQVARLDRVVARIYGPKNGRGPANGQELAVGEMAPDVPVIAAVSRDQEVALDLKAIKDDVIVLAFLEPHSVLGVAYEDRIKDIVRDYQAKSVKLVGISVGPENSDRLPAIKAHVREKRLDFTFADDAEQTVSRSFGATVVPEFFVLGPDRRIAYVGAFDDSVNEAKVTRTYLKDAIDALLAGKHVEVSKTKPLGVPIRYRR
jgi:tetratricopeptide (TPR) repeat protein/peroxiredoxin